MSDPVRPQREDFSLNIGAGLYQCEHVPGPVLVPAGMKYQCDACEKRKANGTHLTVTKIDYKSKTITLRCDK